MTTYKQQFSQVMQSISVLNKILLNPDDMAWGPMTEEEADDYFNTDDSEWGTKSSELLLWIRDMDDLEEDEVEEYCFKDTTIDSVETDICFCSVGGCAKPTEFDEEEQYKQKCDNDCGTTLSISTAIMCWSKGEEEKTLCNVCYWDGAFYEDDDNEDNEEEIISYREEEDQGCWWVKGKGGNKCWGENCGCSEGEEDTGFGTEYHDGSGFVDCDCENTGWRTCKEISDKSKWCSECVYLSRENAMKKI